MPASQPTDPSAPAGASPASWPARRVLGVAVATAAGLTALIAALGPPISEAHTFGPYRGNFVYRWVLDEPTDVTRAVVWALYGAHQLTMWGLIYHAQRNVGRYTAGLHRVNRWALGANLSFALLHIVQTHWLYDGLAQDVHEISSLASVAVMLTLVLLMENHTRGLFMGKPLPISRRVVGWIRKYHGYYFSWAITYTFWYHPTETTLGHLAGFAYIFLLMAQGSLFFTRAHLNKWWKVSLEGLVVVHAGIVAYHMDLEQGLNTLWRFVLGFAAILVFTQVYGLDLPRPLRSALILLWLAGVLRVFLADPDAGKTLWRVPVAEYLAVLIFAALIALGLWVFDLLSPRRRPRAAPAEQPR